jgi:tripartite-type tricarboxylate transporter receptor subunit TctC
MGGRRRARRAVASREKIRRGVLVPSGTLRDIIASLHREIVKILALPDMKEQFATLGYDLVASTPDEFAHRIKVEIEAWGKVIRAAKIKAE